MSVNGMKRVINNNPDKESVDAFADALRALTAGEIIGREVIFFDSTGSTNDAAMKIAAERDDPEGIVVVADTQTGGRGRLGRNWVSPPGVNLYFTILLKPAFSPDEAPLLTLMAAVASVSAIRKVTGLEAGIKWPNDILVSGRKAGGILLEMKTDADMIRFVAIGIGINVNMDVEALPEEIRSLSTTLTKEGNIKVDRARLLENILTEAERLYKDVVAGKGSVILKEWREFSSMAGRQVSVQMHDKIISGIAEDIDDKGRLIVRLPSGGRETVSAGDVTILKDQK
jgi:BirA family biotin operon repressor/biotin-[acetyl-CoA-carboxylase] ligase